MNVLNRCRKHVVPLMRAEGGGRREGGGPFNVNVDDDGSERKKRARRGRDGAAMVETSK